MVADGSSSTSKEKGDNRWIGPILSLVCLVLCFAVIIACGYLWCPEFAREVWPKNETNGKEQRSSYQQYYIEGGPTEVDENGRPYAPTHTIPFGDHVANMIENFWPPSAIILGWKSNTTVAHLYEGELYSLNTEIMKSEKIKWDESLDKMTATAFYGKYANLDDARRNSDKQRLNIAIQDEHGQIQNVTVSKYLESPCHPIHVYSFNNSIYYGEFGQIAKKISPDDDFVHGVFDWVYWEEIRNREDRMAAWFGGCSTLLAFASYKPVGKEIVINTKYDDERPYPATKTQRFPVVGVQLAEYSISIVDLNVPVVEKIRYEHPDHEFLYLFEVQWIESSSTFLVTWTNRLQTVAYFTKCRDKCVLIATYKFGEGRHADTEAFLMTEGREGQYFMKPSETGVTESIGRLNIKSGQLDTLETTVNVKAIVGVEQNEDGDEIFFEARSPGQSYLDLYSVTAKDGQQRCYTCDLTVRASSSFHFLEKVGLAVVSKKDHFTPELVFMQIDYKQHSLIQYFRSPYKSQNNDSRVIADLLNITEETIPLGNGFDAHVQLILPKSHRAMMKVLLYVYNGPNYNHVNYAISPKSLKFLAYGYAVVIIDARGRDSWKSQAEMYKKMGTIEMDDQVVALKKVLKKYPFLDSHSVTVYGHSYGGFAALHIPQKAQNFNFTFKCAISGAPVTQFRFYDATYTERYMGIIDPHNSAYKYTDATTNLEVFRKTHLLLLHGLADDNVHFRHSARLIKKLNDAVIPYDLKVFPESAHGLPTKPETGYMKQFLLEKC